MFSCVARNIKTVLGQPQRWVSGKIRRRVPSPWHNGKTGGAEAFLPVMPGWWRQKTERAESDSERTKPVAICLCSMLLQDIARTDEARWFPVRGSIAHYRERQALWSWILVFFSISVFLRRWNKKRRSKSMCFDFCKIKFWCRACWSICIKVDYCYE